MSALTLLLQEGPDASLSWLLWVVLGFFLLMVVVGWLVSRNRASQPPVRQEVHREPEPAVPAIQPKIADDLTIIEGIGPKVAKVLNDIGIHTFEELANADPVTVQQALNTTGMRYMDPAGWIEQARLAASGDMEGLARLQSELRGGRRVA